MKKNLRFRGIVIALVTLISLGLLYGPINKPNNYTYTLSDFYKPSKLKQNLSENIKLGLDLKGGTHLVLQVQAEEVLKTLTENEVAKATEILKQANIPVTAVKYVTNGQISIEATDVSKLSAIQDKLKNEFVNTWAVSTSSNVVTYTINASYADELRRTATTQAMTIIEQRINLFGVAEPTIQLQGRPEDHRILVQMPGVDNPDRVKQLLRAESKLDLMAVVPGTQLYPTMDAAIASLGGIVPPDRLVLPALNERNKSEEQKTGDISGYYIVEKTPIVMGGDLRNAYGTPGDQGTDYKVIFELKPDAAKKFGEWTGKNIGNPLAIVLNNMVKTAPTIQGQITDTGSITGNFSKEESEDLGLTLRSGALPARLEYLEERTVGPSLGADSIRQGILASVVGLSLVILFMLFYYKFSGVNAVIALVLNLLILLAGLAMFGATLTLPGIAGVILLIGMAVDSNVLIFERIRDELHAGKIVTSAVDTGFDKALVTIIDTHVTTLVSAAFLYLFSGPGPVRGFAVTLFIGLLANLFTAIFVSRTMFAWVLNRKGHRAETISI